MEFWCEIEDLFSFTCLSSHFFVGIFQLSIASERAKRPLKQCLKVCVWWGLERKTKYSFAREWKKYLHVLRNSCVGKRNDIKIASEKVWRKEIVSGLVRWIERIVTASREAERRLTSIDHGPTPSRDEGSQSWWESSYWILCFPCVCNICFARLSWSSFALF